MKTLKYLTLFVSLLLTNLVLSKEIIVISTANSGNGTLREAVNIAQPNDTIIINVKGEILLTSTIYFNTSNITVIGPYPKHNNIKSSTAITMFQFSANDITLKGLGFVGSTNVYNVVRINNASNVKFIDCLFENNVSSDTGTIRSDNSQFVLLNTAFINNQSSQGGAISIDSILSGAGETEIKNCTFYQNTSNSHGGAIYGTTNTSIILANNLFKENTASGQGQAIQLYSGTIIMYNNIIQGNGSGSDNQMTYSSGVYITGVGTYGNVYVLNSGESNAISIQYEIPFGTNLNLRSTIKEDGYGLKYFTIVPFSSGFDLKDKGYNGISLADMNEDCRRAPRILYGTIDPGPCEYTANRVTDNNLSQLNTAISSGGFIEFDITTTPPAIGPYVFDLPSNSSITDVNIANTYIDGFSQPGSVIPGPPVNGSTDVTPAILPIEFTTTNTVNNGININADSVTIAGLDIYGFDQYGIYNNANNAKIFGNHIGFNGTSGSYTVYENKVRGIYINQANNVVIGGYQNFQRNVISGNGQSGGSSINSNIYVYYSDNCKIFGNFIGAQPEGNSTFNISGSQTTPGIFLYQTNDCTIGDSFFGSRNVIGGNLSDGIKVQEASNTKIDNNFIGLGIDGFSTIENNLNGIYVFNIFNPINIGSVKGNVISGNINNGIFLNNLSNSTSFVENNIIGLGKDSTTIVSNNQAGINILSCTGSIYIGSGNKSNIISTNIGDGVIVSSSDGVSIDNNIIGTNGTGNIAKPNSISGVHFSNTTNCQIKYNLISGNTGDGILLDGNGSGTQVFGNLIGTDGSGQNAIPNGEDGIEIEGSHESFIGAGFPLNNNVISGNTKSGIHVNGNSTVLIAGNNIGLSKDQNSVISNQENGINLVSADNVTIGHTNPNNYNTISGNTLNGIMLDSSDNTSIFNCIIGTDSSQTLNAGNGVNGIYVYRSNNHNIGVDVPNVIVNHTTNNGILLETVINDTIQNNSIGVSNNNGSTLPNGVGINIINNSNNNQIGGFFATQKNKIGGNTSGIKLDGSTVNNNDIVGNSIGLTDSLGYIVSKPNNKGIEIINGADNNNIGEVNLVTKKNVVSGNQTGIYLNNVKGINIYRNYIGSDTNNVGSIQNYYGIHIDNCNDAIGNNIGQTNNLTDGPIISGNYIGILIDNNSQNQYIKNCRIGVKVTGLQELPNTYGILIQNNSAGNYIGGNSINESNLISGNDSTGITINNCNNNFILGNYIGTNITALDSLPNLIGIYINGSDGNNIGSNISGDENVISSNTLAGLLLDNNSNNTTIVNNFFGTNSTGDGVYTGSGNFYGVYIKDFTTGNNTIGGDRSIGEGNTFSNTNIVSIAIENTSSAQYIKGNKIGISFDGSQTITNTFVGGTFGIYLKNSSNVTIGGTSTGAENSIANIDAGIMITNSSNTNTISHNFIGNDTTGTNMLTVSLQGIGVRIDTSAHDNIIGPANVISGNDVGVRILNSGTSNNKITNNFIGVDFSGNTALPNNKGVEIGSGATNNLIGGIYSTDKNVISGNSQVAINIADLGTSGNVVSGNLIGLGIDETSPVINNAGIAIFDNANNNIIGGSIADSTNYICSNNLGGVFIGTGANNNFVRGNKIGVKPDNSPSGNMASGIIIDTGNDNFIGGINSNEGNEIANNSGDGIEVKNSGTNNQFLGNVIHDNGGNGIDINIDGPTPNNTTGLQNNVQMPTILQAFDCSGGTNDVKVGVELRNLNSGSNYMIEFYDVTSSPDASGYGEANAFIQRFNYTAVNTTDTAVFSIGNYSPSTILTATLTALNGNGGTSEFSQNDTITNEPTAPVFTVNDGTCNGSNDAYISVQTYAMNYSILNSDSIFHDNSTITLPSPSGAQTVVVRYLNGCEVTSSGLNVGAGPIPTFTTTVSNDTCSLGGQVILDASGNSIGTLGTQPYIDVNNASVTNVNVFSGLIVGTYQYAIVTSLAGVYCYSDTSTINITAVDLVADGVMDFAYNDFCASSNGVVTTQPTFSNGTYTVAPSVSINSSNGEIIGATSGTQYTVSYAYGTSCTTSQTVTASAPIDASFSYDAIMNQTDSLCWGNQSSPSTTNTGGDFSISGVGTPSITTTGVINAFPGVYNVEYITSNSACPDTITVAVTILSLPIQPNITTTDSIICVDEIPSLLTTQNSVDWYDNPTGTVLASNVNQYQPTNLQLGVNTFYASYTDANGCQSPNDSINIIKPDLSTLNSTADSISTCLGSEVKLDVTNDNAVSYFWSKNPNVDDSNEPTLIVSPSNDTYYYVALTDTNGCFVHDSILVTIKDPSECNIETYTAFSPNGDNVNDTWIIDGIEGYNENTVYIYNRWGDLIRKIENYDNSTNVWDGTSTFGNTAVAAGTYFYIVEANGTKALSGWVNVVK